MKYDAFISYRHAELDTYVAKRIHKLLETFKVPRAIQKKSGKKKIARVFRDQEELPIGSSLTDNIELALENSEFLVVICSPRTPASEWVEREIDTFIKLHDRNHVLAVLVEGEPDESFPKRLLVDENGNAVEPLAADVRGASQKEINSKIKTEVVRLSAPLLYCSYDDLRQRHRERKMRKMAAILTGVAVLGCAFGVYSTISASLIKQNFREKQISQSKYLADTSLSLLEYGDRKNAALVALEALAHEENDRPFVASAQYALSSALHCYATGNDIANDCILNHDSAVSDFDLSDDGEFLVSLDYEERVRLWNLNTYECVATIDNHIDENGLIVNVINVFKTDKGFLIAYKDSICLYDNSGKLQWAMECENELVDCQISDDSELIVAVYLNKCVFIDGNTGKITKEFNNTQEHSFIECCISPNKKNVAISHIISDDKKNCYITLYNVENDKSRIFKTKNNYIQSCSFIDDNNLIAISLNNVTDFDSVDEDDGALEFFSTQDEKAKWCQIFDYKNDKDSQINFEYSKLTNKCIFSSGEELYVLNESDGKIVNKTNYGYQINCLRVSTSSDIGFISNSGRKIQLFNTDTGALYDYDFADTDFDIQTFDFSNGQVVILGTNSNDLLVMNYAEGPGLNVKQEMDNKIKGVYVSKDESIYLLLTEPDDKYKCSFFNDKDELIYEIEEIDSNVSTDNIVFADNNILVAVERNGKVHFIDPVKKSSNSISIDTNSFVLGISISTNGEKIVCFYSNSYYIIDINSQKIEYQGELDIEIDSLVYAPDKEIIYTYSKESGFCSVDVKNNKSLKLNLNGYEMLYSVNGGNTMAIDEQEKYLAMPCSDSNIRILDLEKMETICEIPFDGRFDYSIEFMPDGNNIAFKGDDSFFKVYNFIDKKYEYISSEEIAESIHSLTYCDDDNIIILHTYSDMYFLDASTFELLEFAADGKCYLEKSKKILSSKYEKLYEFPYMDVEMLVKEVKNQFGDSSLSENQRLKYNID